MKYLCKIGLSVSIALLLCGNAYALQLIYPLDGTYVTKSNYLIVKGGADPFLSGISIEINGVKSDIIDISADNYRAAFGDMLVVEPLFDSGENRIVVEGYLGDEKMATVSATVYYLTQLYSVPPTTFVQEVFHTAEREAPCASCHNMTPSPADLSSSVPAKNACASCHMRMLDKAHVHGPVGVYECTYCHDVNSEPNKYQARPGDASLCMECHEDKMDEYRQSKFLHGPVEAGLCLTCHDPHASNERGQLTLPAYELCISCHDKVAKAPHVSRGSMGKPHPLKGVVNPAGMGEDLSCVSCHTPHAGESDSMFRWGVTSRFGLCDKCHNK